MTSFFGLWILHFRVSFWVARRENRSASAYLSRLLHAHPPVRLTPALSLSLWFILLNRSSKHAYRDDNYSSTISPSCFSPCQLHFLCTSPRHNTRNTASFQDAACCTTHSMYIVVLSRHQTRSDLAVVPLPPPNCTFVMARQRFAFPTYNVKSVHAHNYPSIPSSTASSLHCITEPLCIRQGSTMPTTATATESARAHIANHVVRAAPPNWRRSWMSV
jgi:hypothetical protein